MAATMINGRKRKRLETSEEDVSVRIGGKIHHEKKEVHKALKKAKVFETQKVVKKLKDLRKKNAEKRDIETVEAELFSFKNVDHDAIGNSAFRSKLLKDFTLRVNENILTYIKEELDSNLMKPGEAGTTLARIQSRLLSSKVLAAQVSASVESLKFLIDPSVKHQTSKNSATDKMSNKKFQPPISEGHEMPDLNAEDAGWESGTINGQEDDDDKESVSSESSISDSTDRPVEQQEGYSEDGSSSGDDELRLKPIKSNPRQVTETKPKENSGNSRSTFLPSLSVGFIKGSDDSDLDEEEAKEADMPRKNRRGQRARRAIWEKKFGRNANHKRKEAECAVLAKKKFSKDYNTVITSPLTIRQTGTDSADKERTKNSSQNRQKERRIQVPSPENDKPLHPSWEAKRKLKEKESGGIVPSVGKKIKF